MATDWSLSEVCLAPCSENTARIKWCKFTFLQNHLNVQMCELKYLFGSPSKHQVLSPQTQLEEARPAGRVPGSDRHKHNRKCPVVTLKPAGFGHYKLGWKCLQVSLKTPGSVATNTAGDDLTSGETIRTNTTQNSPRSP